MSPKLNSLLSDHRGDDIEFATGNEAELNQLSNVFVNFKIGGLVDQYIRRNINF